MSAVRAMRADEEAGFAALLAQCAEEPARFTVQSAADLFTDEEREQHAKHLAEQGARYAERLNDAASKQRDLIRRVSGERAAKQFETFALGLQSAEKFATKADVASACQIRNLIPRTGSGLHSGASKSLKTFTEIWIADQINQNGGKAVLVIAEGAAGFKRRLRAYSQHTGVPLADLPAVLPFAVDLSDTDSVVGFIGALKVLHPDVTYIAFDTKWRCSGPLKENDATDQAKLFGNVDLIARTFNAFCMLVAHLGKDERLGVRGSSSQYAAVDIELRQERDGDKCTLRTEKNKDGPDDIQRTFDVIEVDLGRNALGEHESSLVLVESAEPAPGPNEKPRGAREVLMLKLITEKAPIHKETLLDECADASTDKPRRDNLRRTLESLRKKRLAFINAEGQVSLDSELVRDNTGWPE